MRTKANLTMSLKIRRIRPDEGLRLRALRLYALADAPTAFGSTLAHEEAYPEDVWHERAAGGATSGDRVTFIAEMGERWVGMATGVPSQSGGPGPMLVSMFVDGTVRRRGVGVTLVESVIGWARASQADRLTLWVTASNEAAVGLYRRCGFRPTGSTRRLAHDPTLIEVENGRQFGIRCMRKSKPITHGLAPLAKSVCCYDPIRVSAEQTANRVSSAFAGIAALPPDTGRSDPDEFFCFHWTTNGRLQTPAPGEARMSAKSTA